VNWKLVVCSMLIAVAVGTTGVRAADSANLESLRKQHQDLLAKYNSVYAQYSQLRETLMRQDEMADVAQRLADAREARDRKIQSSDKVSAAYKAYNDAVAAMNGILEAEIAADAQGKQLVGELASLDDQIDELDSQQRIASFMLSEIQRRVARKPPVRPLYEAYSRLENAAYEAARKDPQVVAAYKAYTEAQQILLARPEVERLRVAYEQAAKASTVVVEANKARDAAKTAYEQALAAAVAAHPETPALKKKIDELTQKTAAMTEAKRVATVKLQEVRQRVGAGSAKVAEARKAYHAASTAYSQAVTDAAPNESAAYQEIEKVYYELLESKVNNDPKLTALRKEVDELQKTTAEMGMKLRRLEGSAPPERPRRRPRGGG